MQRPLGDTTRQSQSGETNGLCTRATHTPRQQEEKTNKTNNNNNNNNNKFKPLKMLRENGRVTALVTVSLLDPRS
jgi:hypothetical protein